jgi:pilus assembly protein CpaF
VFDKRPGIATGFAGGERRLAAAPGPASARVAPDSVLAAEPLATVPPGLAFPAEAGRFSSAGFGAPIIGAPTGKPNAGPNTEAPPIPGGVDARRSDEYCEVKSTIFGALVEAIDTAQLAQLDADAAREEIRDIVNELIAMKNIALSIAEQEDLLDDIGNDVLGYGPLAPLLARDEIAGIMVNGSGTVYIEVGGKIQRTGISFRDNQQLLNICQRIVSQVGRRVDEASPICDTRLPDGSRVNCIVPPLALDGPALTIRKFKKDRLTLEQLVGCGSISPEGAELLKIIGRCRINTLVSGGTGSGTTTLLNCLTRYIDNTERIVTCEDAAELQLQQPHVVRLQTRSPNVEGEGQITMRDLVRNCLRMRPERIIVGEVRGPEAFDLLQAMNSGHHGSMGTLYANSPREALSRVESMITTGGHSLPSRSIREMICGSVDVIVHGARLRDGSRRITHITEVVGMEGDIIVTRDLLVYEIAGEDANGNLIGRHKSTGIGRPKFWERARDYGEEARLAAALDAVEVAAEPAGR